MKKYCYFVTGSQIWFDAAARLYREGIAKPVLWLGDDCHFEKARGMFGNDVVVRMLDFVHYQQKINNVDYSGILYLASPRLLELDEEDCVQEELSRLKWVMEKVKKECDPNFIFYYFSSCSVYGRQDNLTKPFKEEFPTQITTRYSELKIKSEDLLKKENKDRFKIFRLSTLYGNLKQQGEPDSPMRKDVLINNLVDDIIQGKQLEIFDKDAKRPHLHISDAVELVHNFVCSGFEGQILNVGFDKNNKTKKEIVDIIEDVVGKKLDVKYIDSKDSRNYQVDFSNMYSYKNKLFRVDDIMSYKNGIFDLWVDKVNIAIEEYDSIFGCSRPAMSSKSWYLKEEGKLSFPKTFGEWSIFSEDGDFLTKDNFRGAIFRLMNHDM